MRRGWCASPPATRCARSLPASTRLAATARPPLSPRHAAHRGDPTGVLEDHPPPLAGRRPSRRIASEGGLAAPRPVRATQAEAGRCRDREKRQQSSGGADDRSDRVHAERQSTTGSINARSRRETGVVVDAASMQRRRGAAPPRKNLDATDLSAPSSLPTFTPSARRRPLVHVPSRRRSLLRHDRRLLRARALVPRRCGDGHRPRDARASPARGTRQPLHPGTPAPLDSPRESGA